MRDIYNVGQIKDDLVKKVRLDVQKNYANAKVELVSKSLINGINTDEVLVRINNSQVAPAIPIEHMVQQISAGNLTLDAAAKQIVNFSVAHQNPQEISVALTADGAREHLYPQVINIDKNAELLTTVPHIDIPGTDLSMIARYRVSLGEDQQGSFIVRNDHLGMFGITGSEACEMAVRNLQNEEYEISSMQDAIMGIGSLIDDPDYEDELRLQLESQLQMYVISNPSQIHGAGVMFLNETARTELRDKIGGDYYVLPSSVHECIAVPVSMMDPEGLSYMVQDVNTTQVAEDDRLSDLVYFVNEKLEIRICDDLLQDDISDKFEVMDELCTKRMAL